MQLGSDIPPHTALVEARGIGGRFHVHQPRKQGFARQSGCQGVTPPAVAGGTDRGHGLGTTTVQIAHHQARTGDRVVGVELDELDGAARAGAELDGIGAQVPFGLGHHSGLQVQCVVRAVGPHHVVFHHKGQGAVRILARRHLAAIAQVALVADDHGLFAQRACCGAKQVFGLELGQRVALIGGVDGLVIRGSVGQ